LEPLLGNRAALGVVADRYVAGLVLSFLVSIAEFVSAERWPVAYWLVLLLLDASFTSYQTHEWLYKLTTARLDVSLAGSLLLWVAALIGGIVAAVCGEVLLFGRRRR
jgi:hypothetical protein